MKQIINKGTAIWFKYFSTLKVNHLRLRTDKTDMMEEMGKVVSKILGALLKSIFISATMFVIALSAVTKQFPPNFAQLGKTYSNLQEMSQLSQKVLAQQQKTLNEQAGLQQDPAENDVEALQMINQKRAELGDSLLSPTTTTTNTERQPASEASKNKLVAVHSQELSEKVKELEFELYRLQQRVSELENKPQSAEIPTAATSDTENKQAKPQSLPQ